eukprot:2563836-Amphidinium_carterae.2
MEDGLQERQANAHPQFVEMHACAWAKLEAPPPECHLPPLLSSETCGGSHEKRLQLRWAPMVGGQEWGVQCTAPQTESNRRCPHAANTPPSPAGAGRVPQRGAST